MFALANLSSLIANIQSSFLRNSLQKFAVANPQIEIEVSPRPRRHPVIIGYYIGGRQKAICVRNLQKEQIMQKAELLRDASGEKLKRVTKPVKSIQDSVRGVWSPYHGGGITV
jgi:large subunit ribosomal protein L43